MKPTLSHLISRSDLIRMMNNLRQCSICNHGVMVGTPCRWCSGLIKLPNSEDRKPIPSVFLNPSKVEKIINVDTYHNVQIAEKIVERTKRDFTQATKKITKTDLGIDKKSLQEQGLMKKSIEFKKLPDPLPRKCDAYDICGKMAISGRRTCSRECTIRAQYGTFTPEGFKTISDEKVAEKLAKQRQKEAVMRNKI